MYILTKDEYALINTDRVETIYIKDKSCTINVSFPNGAGCNIATYKKLDNCKFALSALHIAISSGDKTFVFPDEEDMEVAKWQSSIGSILRLRRQGTAGSDYIFK